MKSKSNLNTLAIKKLLTTHGLIAGAIAVKDCPKNIEEQLINTGIEQAHRGNLVVVANTGAQFWQALQQHTLATTSKHPIDDFSLLLAQQLITLMDTKPSSMPHKLLYPSTANVSLMAMGNLLGWTHASPLGMALHHKYGPWFAYRFVFYFEGMVPNNFQLGSKGNAVSPCLSCMETHGENTPCVSACPAQAVSSTSLFDIARCSEYQNSENTQCEKSCLARNACPAGQAFRYSAAQQAHHMHFAINGLKRWLARASV